MIDQFQAIGLKGRLFIKSGVHEKAKPPNSWTKNKREEELVFIDSQSPVECVTSVIKHLPTSGRLRDIHGTNHSPTWTTKQPQLWLMIPDHRHNTGMNEKKIALKTSQGTAWKYSSTWNRGDMDTFPWTHWSIVILLLFIYFCFEL